MPRRKKKDKKEVLVRSKIEELEAQNRLYRNALADLKAENVYLRGACNEMKEELSRTIFNEEQIIIEYNRMQRERLKND